MTAIGGKIQLSQGIVLGKPVKPISASSSLADSLSRPARFMAAIYQLSFNSKKKSDEKKLDTL
jgi:hypothetical protein